MLAIIGVDGFHLLLRLFQPRQLCRELFHGKAIIGADSATAHGTHFIQQSLNFYVLAHVLSRAAFCFSLRAVGKLPPPEMRMDGTWASMAFRLLRLSASLRA